MHDSEAKRLGVHGFCLCLKKKISARNSYADFIGCNIRYGQSICEILASIAMLSQSLADTA